MEFWSSEPFTGLEVENTPPLPVLIGLKAKMDKIQPESQKVKGQGDGAQIQVFFPFKKVLFSRSTRQALTKQSTKKGFAVKFL